MDEQQEYELQLESLLSKWQRIYENGDASGSEVPDGLLLNQIRAEMLETAQELADETGVIPERYQKQVPEVSAVCYMARADEIRRQAKALLEAVRQSADYQRMVQLKPHVKNARGISVLQEMTDLMDRLAYAIECDDLCTMRCLFKPDEIYSQISLGLEALMKLEKKTQERHKRLLGKGQITGQYSIYDLSA